MRGTEGRIASPDRASWIGHRQPSPRIEIVDQSGGIPIADHPGPTTGFSDPGRELFSTTGVRSLCHPTMHSRPQPHMQSVRGRTRPSPVPGGIPESHWGSLGFSSTLRPFVPNSWASLDCARPNVSRLMPPVPSFPLSRGRWPDLSIPRLFPAASVEHLSGLAQRQTRRRKRPEHR